MQVETHHGPLILISGSLVVRLSGVSGCDVSLGLGLEVSWKRVGMYVGGAQREERGKEKAKKMYFEKMPCGSGGERFPFFHSFKSWVWSPPTKENLWGLMGLPATW